MRRERRVTVVSDTGLTHPENIQRGLELLLVLAEGDQDLSALGGLLPDYVPSGTSKEPGEQLGKRLKDDFTRLHEIGFHIKQFVIEGAGAPDRKRLRLQPTGFVPVTLPREIVPTVIELMGEARRRALPGEKRPLRALAVAAEAVQKGCQVEISADGRLPAVLDPLQLVHTNRGHDRLVARKVDSDVILTYRLDSKWELELLDSPISAPAPTDIDRYTNPLTWGTGAMTDVEVEVRAGSARKAEYLFGSAITSRTQRDDDTVALAVQTTDVRMLAEYIVHLGTDVTEVSPSEAREAILAHLRQIQPEPTVKPRSQGMRTQTKPAAESDERLPGEVPSPIAAESVRGSSGLSKALGALLLALAHLDRIRTCTTDDLARESGIGAVQIRGLLRLYEQAFANVQDALPGLQWQWGITVTKARGGDQDTVESTLDGRHLARLGRREVTWEELLPAARLASSSLPDLWAGLAHAANQEEAQARIDAYEVLVAQARQALGIEFPEALGAKDSDRLAQLREVLGNAIGAWRVVEVDYISEYSNKSGRRWIFPVALVELASGWELAALDVEAGWEKDAQPHVKAFNLSRMSAPRLGDHANPPADMQRLRGIYENRRQHRSTNVRVALPTGHYGVDLLLRQWQGKVVNDNDGYRFVDLQLFPPAELRLQRLAFRWPQMQVILPKDAQPRHYQEAQRLIDHFSA
ncbi:MAG: WYL domain-containing protein [Candidatus Nanopelagicales bacterium]|nr:WYL domain-containing protein [Candidatus Nanopelagicales bacterium]